MKSYLSAVFCITVLVAGAKLRDAAHLNAIPQLAVPSGEVAWDELPRIDTPRIKVFEAVENVAGYNMHPSLAYFEGRWWAMWSSGVWGEDMPGQKVRFANSVDGVNWSEARVLAEPDPTFMLTPTGFWVRNGELLALACHRRGKPVVDGKRQKVEGALDHTTRIYRFSAGTGTWTQTGKLPDTFSDKPIERLSTGEWAMVRATQAGNRYYAVGGVTAIDSWQFFPIPEPADGHPMTESHLFELPAGGFSLFYRDNKRSHHLYRAFSEDRGHTWTVPVPTDFPDQTAKFSVLRLSTGGYLMASNPREAEERFPLTVSLSRDGLTFDRIYSVVGPQAGPRYPNFTKRSGAQYPHAIEVNGQIMIIYSLNQESIEVIRIPVERLPASR